MRDDFPHDYDAERAVIADILADPRIMPRIAPALPDPQAFWHEDHRIIYGAMLRIHNRGELPDNLTVLNEITAGMPEREADRWMLLLTEAQLDPLAVLPELSVQRVRRVWQTWGRRRLLQAAAQIAELAVKEEKLFTAQSEAMTTIAKAASRPGLQGGLVAATDVHADLLNHFQQPVDEGYCAAQWGIPWLDDQCPLEGNVIVGAAPSTGKTTLAETVAEHNAENGCVVLFASCEMDPLRLARRRLARRAGIPIKHQKPGQMSETEIEQAAQALDATTPWASNLFYVSGVVNVNRLRLEAQAVLAQTGRLDLVIVDYVQLVQGEGRSPYEKATNVAIGIQNLQAEFRCPFISLSQLSRVGVRQDEPTLDTLKETGALEQAADIVILLRRGQQTIPMPGWGTAYAVDAILAKNRDGGLGRTNLYMIPGRFIMLGEG